VHHKFAKRRVARVVVLTSILTVFASGVAIANSQPTDDFGVKRAVDSSSKRSISETEAQADPLQLVTLAKGLRARVVSTEAAADTDMIALWPNDRLPTHLITCNESDADEPALQRITLKDGAAQTILTGTDSCDPVRRTAWGTIVFGEETDDGQLYELIDPLHTTGVTLERATGAFSGGTGSDNFARREAVGRLAFEGLALYDSGLLYYGDEQRPHDGTPGGAYFKFVPAQPWTNGQVDELTQSPLAAGSIYGLRVGLREDNETGGFDTGQGNQTGDGTWVRVCGDAGPTACTNVNLREAAGALHLTGYYRPEDLEVDRRANNHGKVRVCGNNTGIEEFANFGETICVTDGSPADALTATTAPRVQYLVTGNPQLAMPDNLAWQPGRGNWVVHEDGDQLQGNNDLWSCLDDGTDADLLSDGCIRIATLNDLEAEWTGGIFDRDGERFFVSVQHNVSGQGLVLEITGWR
jgi:secreted PhoX family phosphatase